MEEEIEIMAILKEMREIIGTQAQEIAMLKAMNATAQVKNRSNSAEEEAK